MTDRVLIADDALDAVRTFLDYIAVTQQMPLTAARWWEKALASQSGEIFLPLKDSPVNGTSATVFRLTDCPCQNGARHRFLLSSCQSSRMRRDCDQSDLTTCRTIAPENSIRPRRAVLRIRLKHLFIWVERVLEGAKLVGLQAGMSGVFGEQRDALVSLLEEPLVAGGFAAVRAGPALEGGKGLRLQTSVLGRGSVRPDQHKHVG